MLQSLSSALGTIFAALAVVAGLGCGVAQTTEMGGEDTGAAVGWVIPPEDAEAPNRWWEWETELQVDNVSRRFPVTIALDSKYWLWINDSLAVFEGMLKRGPTPSGIYADTLDLAAYLQPGKNRVYLLQWFWGKDGFSHRSSSQAGLYFATAGRSPADWRVRAHPAYGVTGPPHPNFRLAEHNIHFDARRANDNVAWRTPLPAPDSLWGPRTDRPIPQWYDSGLQAYQKVEREETDSTLIVRAWLPKNLTVTPWFDITPPGPGATVDLRTDNYRGGGAPNVRGEYITNEGRQQFEMLAFVNGHYVIYTFPKGTQVHQVQFRETRYPANYVGRFTCDDPALNVLWEKALNTLNVDIRDVISDCPDRERAQWWGDVAINLEELFYAADSSGLPIVRKAYANLVEWQRPDGTLYSPVPAGNWHNELPTQMLASIASLPVYFAYTGDTTMLRYAYPAFRRYLELWQTRENGLVAERPGGWTWLDWGNNLDSTALYNVWYHKALTATAEVASILSLPSDLPERVRAHRAAVNRLLTTPAGYRSAGKGGMLDDRPQGIAVVAGLADTAYWRVLTAALARKPYHASPYSEKYILEALFQMGEDSLALHRMRDRYRSMIEHPWITTLWEGWGIGEEGFGGGTYNHAWSGGPLTLLSKYVAGVRPAAAGYARFVVAPQPGDLGRIDCRVPSPRGEFRVSFRRTEAGKVDLTVNVPAGCAGQIRVPSGYLIHEVNGKPQAATTSTYSVGPDDPRSNHIIAYPG